ncbi:MAG: hypothetical protein ACKOE6_12105 [Flammeovirgaceae bacterium]
MGCYKLTYDYRPTELFVEQGEKNYTVEWQVWVNPSSTFDGVDDKVLNSAGPDHRLTMQDVANQINGAGKAGIGKFLNFILDSDYGPRFFTNSIKSGPETRASGSKLVPESIAFGLKTAAWGHKYFGQNDEVRHMIGAFMVAENYGPISADNITTGNEFFGLITIDIPNWINGRSSSAFEFHDLVNNRAGIMLWAAYRIAIKFK